jgi:hypothetical protein
METKSYSVPYYASLITVTATQQSPENAAVVQSIEIDGELIDFEEGEIESGKTLDEALDNGLRKATCIADC